MQFISKFGTLFGRKKCKTEDPYTYVVEPGNVAIKSDTPGRYLVRTNCVIDSVVDWSCPPVMKKIGQKFSTTLTYPAMVVELGLPMPSRDDCIVGRRFVWKYQWYVIKLGEFFGCLPILLQPVRKCRWG